jgi:DNA-binding NtrC family response regulator
MALQNGRITRLGEARQRAVDVKLIAATNTDLENAVREGGFRKDLYARLNPAARIVLAPLRERRDDIRELVATFVTKSFASGPDRELLAAYMKAAALSGPVRALLVADGTTEPAGEGVGLVLSKRTLSELRSHPWPGNIRELEFTIASAAVLAVSDALRAAEAGKAVTAAAPRAIPVPAKLVRELLDAWPVAGNAVSGSKAEGLYVRLTPGSSLRDVARDAERQVLETLFEDTGGDFRQMASRLLKGDPDANARRVRLRFNQLGLRARALRKIISD